MQGGAADDHAVALDDQVVLDLVLQALSGTRHQHAAPLQGLEQFEQAADVA